MSDKCIDLGLNMARAHKKAKEVNPEGADDMITDLMKQGLEKKKPTIYSKLNEYLINAMLLGLGTPLVNFVSNFGQSIILPSLNYLKSLPKGTAARREAAAMFSALSEGWKTDLLFFNKGWKTGLPVDFELSPKALGMSQKQFNELMIDAGAATDIDGNVNPELAARALAESYDYITKSIPGRLGEIVRVPTRFTVAIDEYFKARLRTQKIFGLLSKKASDDEAAGKGEYSKLFEDYKKQAFSGGGQEYVNNLSKMIDDEVGFVQAISDVRNYATDGTLQTKLAERITKVLEIVKGDGSDPVGLAMTQSFPFIRTPWNIFKEGMSYVPGVGFVVRPTRTKTVVSVNENTGRITTKNELVKMPLEDLVPRQMIGFGMVALVGSLYHSGRITGAEPTDPAERNTWQALGKKPYSIKPGDTWYEYGRFDPIATPLGLIVDAFAVIDRYEKTGIAEIPDKEDRTKKTRKYVREEVWSAVKGNVMNKTFLEGFSDLITAFESPDFFQTYAENIGKRFVPALSASVARTVDPYERVAGSFTEKLKQRVPVLREELPPKYQPFGETDEQGQPLPVKTDISKALTSIGVYAPQSALQKKVEQLGITISPLRREIGGVELSTEQFSEYQKNFAKVANPYFDKKIDDWLTKDRRRVEYVLESKVLPAMRERARNMLVKKYPDLKEAVINEKLFERGLTSKMKARKGEE